MQSCRVQYLYIFLQNISHSWNIEEEGVKGLLSRMFGVSAVKSCLLVLPENALINIYQDDCLNRTRRRMIPIYMPKCMWPQPYTKSYRQLRKAESRRNSLHLERVHQLVIQMVSPENIGRINIIHIEQVIHRSIYICLHVCM